MFGWANVALAGGLFARKEAGTLIDRYVVERLIGQGGNAAVYAVRHNDLGSHHAMKILNDTNDEMRRQLMTEGRAQASVKHPNIVSVIDIVNNETVFGLVMELIEGPRLDSWIESTVFSVEQLDEMVAGIIAGVSAAHKAGLVHRDLKPGNIMVEVHDEQIIPKVTDFGLAKILNPTFTVSGTEDGQTKGTPSYMAPEQIRDSKSVDHRADLFSMGAILYELCCGKKAFEGRTMVETLIRIQDGNFVAPRKLRPRLPQRMEDAIMAALVVNPDERVQSCTALLDLWFEGELQTGSRCLRQLVEERAGPRLRGRESRDDACGGNHGSVGV